MPKIGSTSNVSFIGNKAIVVIRRPLFELIMCAFFSIMFIVFGSLTILTDETSIANNTLSFRIFFLFVMYLFMSFPLYIWGLREESEINLSDRSFIRKKKFFGIYFKTITHNWSENYYFKNEFVYDSYNRISTVWLVVVQNDPKRIVRLLRFHNKNTFDKFKSFFNQQFPDHEILEWHD